MVDYTKDIDNIIKLICEARISEKSDYIYMVADMIKNDNKTLTKEKLIKFLRELASSLSTQSEWLSNDVADLLGTINDWV